jgi:hypothetical protein
MEPSLRSSTLKGIDCKLRKTDPALHETTQRFVESLLEDIRISQYSDLNHAGVMMKTGKWMFLHELAGGRVGFLVMISSKHPVVWMDDKGKSSYIVPMRIQSSLTERGSIMISSLNKTEGILRIEDIKILGGEDMRGVSFMRRWERLLDFYRNSYVYDDKLQRDLRIEPAIYMAVDSVQNWGDTPPIRIIAQNDTLTRRLNIQLIQAEPKNMLLDKHEPAQVKVVPRPPPQRQQHPQPVPRPQHPQPVPRPQNPQPLPRPQNPQPVPRPQNPQPLPRPQNPQPVQRPQHPQPFPRPQPKPKAETKPPVRQGSFAIPDVNYPDTYTIIINEEKKGYAAVQDIDLSKELRIKSEGNKEIPVKVEWNAEFNSYEILSLL